MNSPKTSKKLGLAVLFLLPITVLLQRNLNSNSIFYWLLPSALLLLSLLAIGIKFFKEKSISKPKIFLLAAGIMSVLSIFFYQFYNI
ncbi:hypothetical protein [Phnomibacter sp. MR]|uniref:hypothetical protein n=1 Tax=Phnomibacter sp. MR TaxID=3042318 RepID=UPI003A808583